MPKILYMNMNMFLSNLTQYDLITKFLTSEINQFTEDNDFRSVEK